MSSDSSSPNIEYAHTNEKASLSETDIQGVLKTFSLKTMLAIACISIACLFVVMGVLAWRVTTDGNQLFTNWLMAIAALGVPMAALFAVLSYRSVVIPLERAKREIDRMCAGDLTGHIESKGIMELARLMKALHVLQINTKQVIGQIREATDRVNTGAREIASGNADLSSRTESQAS